MKKKIHRHSKLLWVLLLVHLHNKVKEDHYLQLNQEQLSQPIAQDGGLYLLHLLDQQTSQVIPFQQARSDVISEFKSRDRQNALAEALAEYKERADIQFNSSLLEQLARDG